MKSLLLFLTIFIFVNVCAHNDTLHFIKVHFQYGSKPLKKYKLISKIKFNNIINLDNSGVNTMHAMLDSLIKKYEKNVGPEKADALITNSCIEAEFIKLID